MARTRLIRGNPDRLRLFKHIGLRMSELRRGCQMTQAEMADFLKMSKSSYSKIESGISPINVDDLYFFLKKVEDISGEKLSMDLFFKK